MYDENQLVEMIWTNVTRKIYEEKGYKFSKINDKFLIKAKELSPSSHAEIDVICDYCGFAFKKKFSNVTKGRKYIQKDACSKCKQIKQQEISRKNRMNSSYLMAKEICEEMDYTFIEPIDDYTNQHIEFEFICHKHGRQKMLLCNFLNKKVCPKCGIANKKKHKLNISDIINKISKDGNVLLNPEEYKRTTTRNLHIKCKCGNEFITSLDGYVHLGVNRCPICSRRISKNELYISNVLDKYNIEYEREKRFKDCRDKNPLPFDFYIPKYNLLIEFDGEQHYKPIRNRIEHFKTTQYHDVIKNDYCKKHNIDLLRIPYWENKNIETIIKNKLSI